MIGLRQVEVGGRKMLYYEGKLQVGLVLVHEIMGMDAYARSVAKSLSQEGFSCGRGRPLRREAPR